MAVIVRAMAMRVSVRVILHDDWQEPHLRSQHPAADPDHEDPGADGEIGLDSLRDKPGGAECSENRDQDNPARVRQSHKDAEDQRVDGRPRTPTMYEAAMVFPCPGVAAWTAPSQKLVRR